mmetsp:Transcript_39077/g.67569  ORF Transcript_39077/g.67569 Transcript_39077/m.67569 type:complete len:111 (-) Transcript_39077:100-432(-)
MAGGGEFVVLPMQVRFGKIAHSPGGNMSHCKGEGQDDATTVSTTGGESSDKNSSYKRALKKLQKANEDNEDLRNQLQVLPNEKDELYEINRGLRATVKLLKERYEDQQEG